MSNKSSVVIIGAGVVGSILALELAKLGLKISIIDKRPLMLDFNPSFDHRTIAIAAEVHARLIKYEVWDKISDQVGKIEQIRITDNDSPLYLHFNSKDVSCSPLGYMVDNTLLIHTVNKMVSENKNITFINEEVKDAQYTDCKAIVITENHTIEADLGIIADGKFSKTREHFGFEVKDKDYGETAIVFKIRHEKPHLSTAWEKFYPSGAFAVLPMNDPNVSGIVWMEKPETAKAIVKQDISLIKEFFMQKMGDCLGENEIITVPYCYPLTLKYAKKSSITRFVLAGDSLHSIHPIAGQGLNLSLLDCDILIDIIKEASNLGMDIGSASVTEKYHTSIKFDDMSMIYITDIIDKVFKVNFPPFTLMRKIGLASINKISILKAFMMNYAMGKRNDQWTRSPADIRH
ncbi:MAG: FAD-dependent monooxygenase [Alphaproteobacteria bacterium]|nr:FAD-dependent monooxygenase [Alphaproteobacteria bacterium]OJV13499.1 MAG: hypothetical protein BGO27_04755 [Alphaproteobacteria bacterium 33-17]